jgi:hypothetical protein
MDDHHATTNHVVLIAHFWMHGVTSNFLFFILGGGGAWIGAMVDELILYSGPTMLLGVTCAPLDHYFILKILLEFF